MGVWDDFHRGVSLGPERRFADFADEYLRQGMRVLDVGCGKGRHSLYCARRGIETHAVDTSEDALKHLREESEKEQLFELLKVAKADAGDLPFPDRYFDAAFSVHVLVHGMWKDVKRYFKEVSRVLKSGGLLFFIELPSEFVEDAKAPETVELERGTYVKLRIRDADVIHHLLSGEDLKELLKDYDIIKEERFRQVGPFMKREETYLNVIARKK